MIRIALLLSLVACATTARPPPQQLPANGRLFDGETSSFVAAERYRGHVVVLDFWAGWCAECKRTVPQITRLASAFSADGLVVIGVNAGEHAGEVAASAKALGIDYPIVLDPDLVFSDQLGAASLPALLVIDRTGAVVHRAKHVDAETLAVIRKLLHPAVQAGRR